MRTVKVLLFLLIALAVSISAIQPPATPDGAAPPPEPQPLARVDFPSYEKRVLPNGLTVYALEHHEQPIVAVRLLIAAGSANDPQALPGVASFTADLLNLGTPTRTATQIAETIDQVGASLGASADMESTIVTASALKENTGLVFELMHDIVLNPAFAPDEIARLQQQALSSLTASMEDPDFLADAVFERAIYGSHPYGHPGGGTLRSIPAIRRDDLARFHATYYAPNISALAIAGDLSTEEAFNLAEQWFGSWQKKDVPKVSLAAIPRIEGRRIIVVDKPDSVQTEVRVGHTTVSRKDPDYFNVLLSSVVLGGSGSGRLNQKLRVEKGLTYGAFATIIPRKGPGSFYSVSDTRTEKTSEALQLIFDEIQRLATSETPEDELTNAKTYIIGSFPLTIELPNDLAARLTNVFLYDLGDDYLKTYRDRLAAVSAANMLRTAKEQISSGNAVVVLVGKAEEIAKTIDPLGKVQLIPASRLDLGSPALVTP
jgi:zinc protease